MKALKKDLQAMVKNLKTLTSKVEKMVKNIDKLDKGTAAKAPAKRGRPAAAKKVKKAAPARGRKKESTAMDTVYSIVAKSRKGVNTATIKEKTGFNDKKIWNAINRLKTQGKIKSARKGVYIKI
ncbi:MAG: hypothetical protein JRH13_15650 [Deltaproteobacteria bacterium]|nr:hypothetical protein [Deltaproteobacteria bacterium]MBW2016189.1 hypothetical protein [Deltaproteobacteria bacterium]MBW2130783.1 hypothetical protein [Deltaproteobacteria bacterium]MBW2302694.1 hypothetical protein [Deltaproteobacteria bacterium]